MIAVVVRIVGLITHLNVDSRRCSTDGPSSISTAAAPYTFIGRRSRPQTISLPIGRHASPTLIQLRVHCNGKWLHWNLAGYDYNKTVAKSKFALMTYLSWIPLVRPNFLDAPVPSSPCLSLLSTAINLRSAFIASLLCPSFPPSLRLDPHF